MAETWVFGFCVWEIPAFLLLAVLAVALIVQRRRFPKRRKECDGRHQ